jgi:adenine-specific DNA-methyltransferase
MATGVSKKKWNGDLKNHPNNNNLDVYLNYEGKQDESEILNTPPSKFVNLWGNGENHLYYGDNLCGLASLINDPKICGKVNLIYIDPPFATNSVFQSRTQNDAYQDILAGSHYIEFLRKRLILMRELLSKDGSIYVHLDENMAFYVKVIMDEIFGRNKFRNWITRKKCNPKNFTRKTYGDISDYIMFYTKSDSYIWNRPMEKWAGAGAAKEYGYIDDMGRRYKKVPIHAPGVRNGETGKPWRGLLPPPGKHWQFVPKTLDEMDARGDIYWSPNGNPRRKIYLDQSAGVNVQDIWLDFRDPFNQMA